MFNIIKDLWYILSSSRKYYLIECDVCWFQKKKNQRTYNPNEVCQNCKLKIWDINHHIKCIDKKGSKCLIECDCWVRKWIMNNNFWKIKSCWCMKNKYTRDWQIKKALDRKTIKHNNYIELEATWWEFIKLDYEDYEKVKYYCWYKSIRWSVESRIWWKLIKIHRLIMNPPKNKVVDHINWNTLDNRKENLRICTAAQNSYNSKKPISWITSKYKWVYKQKNKYIARIQQSSLWSFDNEIDAAIAYNKAAIERYWEYARLNEL